MNVFKNGIGETLGNIIFRVTEDGRTERYHADVELFGKITLLSCWIVKLAEDCDMIPDIIKDLEVPDDFCEAYAEREDHTVLGGEPTTITTPVSRENYIDDARSDYWEDMCYEEQADIIVKKLVKELKKS